MYQGFRIYTYEIAVSELRIQLGRRLIFSATKALCYTEQKYTTSECRSTPDLFACEIPTHPSAELSKPDIQEYPTHPTDFKHRLPHYLASEPKFHGTHSTILSHSIHQPSPYWSTMHYRSCLLQGQPCNP